MSLPSTQRRNQFPVLEIAGIGLILISVVMLVGQLGDYSAARQEMPSSLVLGEVPVSGLTRDEAQAYLEQVYGAPVVVWYKDEELRLDPAQVSFQVNSSSMLASADEHRSEGQTFWSGFWDYVWLRPEEIIAVDLVASFSEEQLRDWLADIASRYDRPPLNAQPMLDTLSFANGQPGYTLDQDASFEVLREALKHPTNREVELVVSEESGARPGMATLESLLVEFIQNQQFQGVVSVYIINLETGEELPMNIDNRTLTPLDVNCEIAVASTSTIKIPIMIDFFRYLDWEPTEDTDDYKNLNETMTLSGNVSANAMLFKIGDEDEMEGTRHVTAMMRALGVQNTFIATPFLNDPDEPQPDIPFITTPAREAASSGTCIDTRADPAAQTTTKDLATMLDMIYQCAEYGGGGIIAAFPTEITQHECELMVDFMSRNEDGMLIGAGLPTDTLVAHKHGWIYDTQGDSAIVYSPGGDYVISVMLWGDVQDWMPVSLTFPVVEGLSKITFNYFNPELINVPRRGLGDLLSTAPDS
jgi:beta-lactamase class A